MLYYLTLAEALTDINALCACVYIYIRQLSSFIDLTVIFNTLFRVYTNFFSQENRQNMKILEVRHFSMI